MASWSGVSNNDRNRSSAAAEPGAARQPLEQFAARALKVRLTRNEVLGAPLFQDLAWNMLLDLFVSEGEGRRVSVSSLTISSGGAQTTALRYLEKLLAYGLVIRADDKQDKRRSWISLTPKTRAAVASLLQQAQ